MKARLVVRSYARVPWCAFVFMGAIMIDRRRGNCEGVRRFDRGVQLPAGYANYGYKTGVCGKTENNDQHVRNPRNVM